MFKKVTVNYQVRYTIDGATRVSIVSAPMMRVLELTQRLAAGGATHIVIMQGDVLVQSNQTMVTLTRKVA